MKAIKSSTPIYINNLVEFKQEIHSKLIRGLGIEQYEYIGSMGKRELMSDIDIAVIGDYSFVKSNIEKSGLEFKLSQGFNQISFGFPFKNQIVQVDLMFSENLEWSKFIYYSPNLLEGESKYKGIYRNLLFADILRAETKNWINETEYNQLTIQFNKGLFLTSKSHLSEKGNVLKTPLVLQSKFITNDPDEFLQILRLNDFSFTFEQVYDQLKDRALEAKIKANFKETCNNLNLEFHE